MQLAINCSYCGRQPRKPGKYGCNACEAKFTADWRRRNKGTVKAYRKKFFVKRARSLNWKRRGLGTVTACELLRLWVQQRGRCALTGVKLTRTCCHVDHIVPIVRGGLNVISNMRWTHPFPNLAKGGRLDSEVQSGPEELPF